MSSSSTARYASVKRPTAMGQPTARARPSACAVWVSLVLMIVCESVTRSGPSASTSNPAITAESIPPETSSCARSAPTAR